MDATRRSRNVSPNRRGAVSRHPPQHPHPSDRAEARQHLGLLVLLLAVSAVALHQVGRGALAGPQLDAPGTWSAWLSARTGTEAAFALLRLVALATTAYLAGATGLGLLARLAGRARWIRWADALAVPAVRRVLQRAFGAGLAVAVALGPAATAPGPGPTRTSMSLMAGAGENVAAGVVTGHVAVHDELPLVLLDPLPAPPEADATPATTAGADTTATSSVPPDAPGDQGSWRATPAPTTTAPTRTLPPASVTTPDAATPVAAEPPAAPESGATPAGPETPGVEVDTWEVGAGDHFWGIAETVLGRAWGRPPTEAETARYWRSLIDRNATRLAVPGNPDIVLVGQVLELGPVPQVA
jgi:hypothetical protein